MYYIYLFLKVNGKMVFKQNKTKNKYARELHFQSCRTSIPAGDTLETEMEQGREEV